MRALLSLLLGATCALLGACAPHAGTGVVSGTADLLVPDTGRVAVEGGTLYYEVRGSGPPLVLLHAGDRDLTMWNPQVRLLTRSFRLIRYDARGHGRSTTPRGAFSTVEDLRLLLDHLGIERASLVGISMGAWHRPELRHHLPAAREQAGARLHERSAAGGADPARCYAAADA